MRAVRLALVLSILAAPALAQPDAVAQALARRQAIDRFQVDQLRMQQDLAARQAVIQRNDLSYLEHQLRTQQTLSAVQAQSQSPQIPPPPAGGAPRSIDVSGLASIPDAALAESNEKVRAAAGNAP